MLALARKNKGLRILLLILYSKKLSTNTSWFTWFQF